MVSGIRHQAGRHVCLRAPIYPSIYVLSIYSSHSYSVPSKSKTSKARARATGPTASKPQAETNGWTNCSIYVELTGRLLIGNALLP